MPYYHHAAQLTAATVRIQQSIGTVLACAPCFETQPIGAADQLFLNSAMIVATDPTPEATLTQLLAIESQMGRVRRERWGNRIIDLASCSGNN